MSETPTGSGETPTTAIAGPAHDPAPTPVPRLLCDVQALTELEQTSGGALWKLAESGRQLDANLIHLPAGEHVETHAEPDLDVLLLVVSGHGSMHATNGTIQLAGGALCWLPHGSTRRISASGDGLTYITVHRRRPGMQISRRPG